MNEPLAAPTSETVVVELDAIAKPAYEQRRVFTVVFAIGVLSVVLVTVFPAFPVISLVFRRPFATGVVTAVSVIILALIVQRRWTKRADIRRGELAAKCGELPIAERVRALLADEAISRYVREAEVSAALGRDGVGDAVILLGKARELGRSPIDVPFEPIPLDESTQGFQSLASSQAVAGSANGVEGHPTLHLPPAWRRRVTLGAGWLAIGAFALSLVIASIKAWEVGKPTMEQMWWLVFLVLMLWGVGGTGAWRFNNQWLLVPGGIVRRSAKSRSSQWKVHLFTRRNAVLLITESRRSNRQVCVADATESATTYVTVAEAQLLLRAWLSPLPAPAADQLSDLT